MVAFPLFILAVMVYVFYRQYGLVASVAIPLGIASLVAAWFCLLSPAVDILVFPFLVIASLFFAAAFAFRRSRERVLEIRWEEQTRLREQHAKWLDRRSSASVQEAWAGRESFLGPRSRRR